ncbi:hypothetical protein GJ496_010215 [Pomphorhynchus laevis]|nr:hypothetical protein GJ496_010215 [Pomphorhynchus laevis]
MHYAAVKHGNLSGSNSSVTCICFDNIDGDLIAGGSSDSALRVWSTSSLRIQHTFTGHNSKISCATFLPSAEQILISGSNDRTIRYWDLASRQCCHTICVGSSLLHVAANSSGLLASSHWDKTVRLWDRRQSSPIISTTMPARISTILWTGDDQYFCTCRDHSIYLYSRYSSNKPMVVFSDENLKIPSDNSLSCLSPDHRFIAVGSDKINIPLVVWNIEDYSTEQKPYIFECDSEKTKGLSNNPIICAAWNPHGRGILALSKQKYITYWR